ncbi:MAG: cation:proton antiporter [Puniceicoccaceae bacterium]
MHQEILILLTIVIFTGSLAQWIAWRTNIPAILLLLGGGVFLGAGTGILNPDEDFGKLLFPMVSLGVALILFEGGLTLKLKEFRESGKEILKLITIGAAITGFLTAIFAHAILKFPVEISALFGAILVITGPTVVSPMLRQIRPQGKVSHVVKWEGILNDPVGAVAAVLIYEVFRVGAGESAPLMILWGIFLTFAISLLLSVLGAGLLMVAMRRRWLPDYLHVPVTLAVVLLSFTLSEVVQKESGLLTVTFLGILLANQKTFPVRHILEFKENLQILLISGLFIVLGARVNLESLYSVGPESLLLLFLMIFLVRPLAVTAATYGSSLDWKERVFLMLMAPRGIVVTAIASVFTLRMIEHGRVQLAQVFFAEILFVIFGTVSFYGIAAVIFAKKMKLSSPRPLGLVFFGAQVWTRAIALALKREGVPVVMLDSNEANIDACEDLGLRAHQGNIFSHEFLESINFSDCGRALAMTANAEINAYAENAFVRYFGRAQVYHLSVGARRPKESGVLMDSVGSILFGNDVTYEEIENRFFRGEEVLRIVYDSKTGLPEGVIPLFCVVSATQTRIFSSRTVFVPKDGSVVLAIGPRESGESICEPSSTVE